MRVERLKPAQVDEYRAIMLKAYAAEPHAFTSTVPEREVLPLEWWTSRVSDEPDPAELVYGAFVGAQLVGVAGLRFGSRQKIEHKAFLYGIFVLPEFRNQGIARALVQAVLKHARGMPRIRVVQLRVTQSNNPAIRLYESCGFKPYGSEPFAMRLGEQFVSVLHMWCAVDQDID